MMRRKWRALQEFYVCIIIYATDNLGPTVPVKNCLEPLRFLECLQAGPSGFVCNQYYELHARVRNCFTFLFKQVVYVLGTSLHNRVTISNHGLVGAIRLGLMMATQQIK